VCSDNQSVGPEDVGYTLSADEKNYRVCFMKKSKQLSKHNSVTHDDSCLQISVKLARQNYACEIVVWHFDPILSTFTQSISSCSLYEEYSNYKIYLTQPHRLHLLY